MVTASQFGMRRLQRWAASACVVLMLLIVGMEAVHAHSQASASNGSGICLLCVSAQTSAPVASITAVETLLIAIGVIAAVPERRRQTTLAALPLFIRPPPAI